jgi:hypothetical protein
MILGQIPAGYRGAHMRIDGGNCRARDIMAAVQSLNVQSDEAIFVYYAGHGAYDPNLNDPSDPSGGHHFQIPDGDLMRKRLLDELLAKNAKLTVVITDTCNVACPSSPALLYKSAACGEPPIVTLLLRYRGVVDISGSSRDQYGWFPPSGGIFTTALLPALANGSSGWSGALDIARKRTQEAFARLKADAQVNPSWPLETRTQILGQGDQSPQAFRFDIKSE